MRLHGILSNIATERLLQGFQAKEGTNSVLLESQGKCKAHFLPLSDFFLSSRKDPDEEEIKRLKSYVVACGVRKQWCVMQPMTHANLVDSKNSSRKKEFEGIEDKPKKQIARLKEILASLGMTGRLSLDKAKAIRGKRELATELGAPLLLWRCTLRLTTHSQRKSLRLKPSVVHVLRKRSKNVLERWQSQRKNPTSPRKSKKLRRANRERKGLVFDLHLGLKMTSFLLAEHFGLLG